MSEADGAIRPPIQSRYGPDGRPTFFADPAIDRFVSVVLNLASELWVQTERVTTLSALIESKGLVTREEIENICRAAEHDPARDEALRSYISRVLSPLRDEARSA
jgi:hypothetical protein